MWFCQRNFYPICDHPQSQMKYFSSVTGIHYLTWCHLVLPALPNLTFPPKCPWFVGLSCALLLYCTVWSYVSHKYLFTFVFIRKRNVLWNEGGHDVRRYKMIFLCTVQMALLLDAWWTEHVAPLWEVAAKKTTCHPTPPSGWPSDLNQLGCFANFKESHSRVPKEEILMPRSCLTALQVFKWTFMHIKRTNFCLCLLEHRMHFTDQPGDFKIAVY
jgi:hypothetical protein